MTNALHLFSPDADIGAVESAFSRFLRTLLRWRHRIRLTIIYPDQQSAGQIKMRKRRNHENTTFQKMRKRRNR